MLWQIEIYPAEGLPDQDAQQVTAEAADLGIHSELRVRTARGYLLEGSLEQSQAQLTDKARLPLEEGSDESDHL